VCWAPDLTAHVSAVGGRRSDERRSGLRPAGMLLLTGLNATQAVRTAALTDLPAVVFVRGKQPGPDVLAMASRPASRSCRRRSRCSRPRAGSTAPCSDRDGPMNDRRAFLPVVRDPRRRHRQRGAGVHGDQGPAQGHGVPAGVHPARAIASYEAEMNVVMYARRATVQLRVTPGTVEIEVQDEGPGIPDVDWRCRKGIPRPRRRCARWGSGGHGPAEHPTEQRSALCRPQLDEDGVPGTGPSIAQPWLDSSAIIGAVTSRSRDPACPLRRRAD